MRCFRAPAPVPMTSSGNRRWLNRVMKVHGLLPIVMSTVSSGSRIAVGERNRRRCSDGFEIGCDNGERVRVAFALDCCDREAMSFLATTEGIGGADVRDLMVAAVEHRFGRINRLPVTIEWLSDNGSCYVADDTRSIARDIGLEPRTTPFESPQSKGMAEAFVRTIKRDCIRVSPCPRCTDRNASAVDLAPTTTRFTRIRLSDIVHPVSSSRSR